VTCVTICDLSHYMQHCSDMCHYFPICHITCHIVVTCVTICWSVTSHVALQWHVSLFVDLSHYMQHCSDMCHYFMICHIPCHTAVPSLMQPPPTNIQPLHKPSIYHQTINLSPNQQFITKPPSHNAVQFPPPYVTFATSHCLSVCSVRSAVLNRVKTVVFTFLEGKMRIWGWNSKQWLLPYWPLTLTNRKQNYTKNIILYTGCIFFCACEDSQFHGIGRMENLHSSEIYRTSECLLTGHCEWRQNIYI